MTRDEYEKKLDTFESELRKLAEHRDRPAPTFPANTRDGMWPWVQCGQMTMQEIFDSVAVIVTEPKPAKKVLH